MSWYDEAMARQGAERTSAWETLVDRRMDTLVWVDQPLALISQIQRSGGTLLSQLFDDHPALHAHPSELHIGWPHHKENWPALDLGDPPAEWFRRLREKRATDHFREGYSKYARGIPGVPHYPDEDLEVFPFMLVPELQRELFERAAAQRLPTREREVLDCYMTSYFNAWLDNRNLYGPGKRWVTGFVPRLALAAANRDAFFSAYPDGRLIFLIREPGSWYASASRYQSQLYGDPRQAAELWTWSAHEILNAQRDNAERVTIVRFEDLVLRTEQTMRALARLLDIEYQPCLTSPTFNGMPIKADSSFATLRHGILEEAAHRKPEARFAATTLESQYDEVSAASLCAS
jgi:hypothetical protein